MSYKYDNDVNMAKAGIDKTLKELQSKIGKKAVLTDYFSRIAYGTDAGCYRKTPEAVLLPGNENEVIHILEKLFKESIPLTFRAAGTSLSGQAISDSVLVQARGDDWSKATVLSEGRYVRVQPGMTGLRLNQLLRPYKVKFGPDPASVNSAMIGGIIANNASGMSCGIHANSYATIESARIVFSDGTLLDTSEEKSREDFRNTKTELVEKIEELKSRIRNEPSFRDTIQEKFKIKNTTGYGLNSFLDYDDPIDIILHLMVGSEGTLGFISEAIFKTIPILDYRASAMVYFRNLKDACLAVPALKKSGVTAIELIDRQALRSIENKAGMPDFIKSLGDEVTALLIDLETEDEKILQQNIQLTQASLEEFRLARDFNITFDQKQINEYWKIRKGVFPSVGGMREPGTVVIIEDVAVKLEYLADAVEDMRKMLDDLNYHDAVIYGHALDGNMHFIFAQDFHDPDELKRYDKLIRQLTDLIVNKYQGSLKAEHGTGINMAPFVSLEWGEGLYGIMKEIKSACDPRAILNPGVIINSDPEAHLKNFKQLPVVDETIDKCIECGFCEINCLTTGHTLSARQRIVVQREIRALSMEGDRKKIRLLEDSFRYAGNLSCAGDGLCSSSCPVDIDTGVFIKKLRTSENQAKSGSRKWAHRIARNFSLTARIIRKGLGAVNLLHTLLGSRIFGFLTRSFRKISFSRIPEWNKYMPGPARLRKLRVKESGNKSLRVVYFPSCINQSMGSSKGDSSPESLVQVTVNVLERAGYSIVFPENMENLCCGTPWESKGFPDIADLKSAELEAELLRVSENGTYPILCDTSPCIYRMRRVMSDRLKMYEPVEFIHDFLLDKLELSKQEENIAFHITCSSTKMEIGSKFHKVAEACTNHHIFPEEVGCCGFAGDKGFSQPGVNNWALRKLKEQVNDCRSGYSNSRTCEIGLSKNSGINYQSIMYLVDRASKQ